MDKQPTVPIVNHAIGTEPAPRARTESGVKLQRFFSEDVETILSVLALTGGNYARTSRQLSSEFELKIHPATVKKMATEQFPVKYAEIQDTLGDKIGTLVTGKVGELALRGTEVQGRLLDKLDEQLDQEADIPVRELAPAFRNVAQATQENIKQKQLLENKPTSITEVRTIEEAIKELEDDDIIVDAQVVEDENLVPDTLIKQETNTNKKEDQAYNNKDTHINETIEDLPPSVEPNQEQSKNHEDKYPEEQSNNIGGENINHINETIEDFPF